MNNYSAIEAEQALLGAVLIDRDVYRLLADKIEPSDFAHKMHCAIWQAFSDLDVLNVEPDYVTVTEALSRQENPGLVPLDYLMELAEFIPAVCNVEQYASHVLHASMRRKLIEGCGEVIDIAEQSNSIAEAMGRLRQLSDLATRLEQHEPATAKQIMARLMRRFENAQESRNPEVGITTGFPTLDAMTGGFRGGQLIYVGARTSIGKTAMLVNLLFAAASSGVPSLLDSAETDLDAVSENLFGVGCESNPRDLLAGENVDDAEYDRITRNVENLISLPIYVDDTPRIDVEKIRARARRAKINHGIQAIFVDYLQLLRPPKLEGKPTREQQVAAMSAELKAIARELDVPVIVAVQVGRGAEKESRPPKLTDLRESGSIEQDADVVLLLHRADRTASEALLLVEKQRQGPTGEIPMQFIGRHQRFVEVEGEGGIPPLPDGPPPRRDIDDSDVPPFF